MGVTAFRQITNNSGVQIAINNHETPSDDVKLQPNSTAGIEMWIPWCTSTSDFKWGHYIIVAKYHMAEVNGSSVPVYDNLFAIWQKDNTVCYSPDSQFHNPGTPIPGVCAINGDRELVINPDFTIKVNVV